MKIQTKAILEQLQIDGLNVPLDEDRSIDLEFSAIDTGGGFKDPMLDFSVTISDWQSSNHQQSKVILSISDPQNRERAIQLTCNGELTIADGQINGRLTDEELTREAIGFIFKLVR